MHTCCQKYIRSYVFLMLCTNCEAKVSPVDTIICQLNHTMYKIYNHAWHCNSSQVMQLALTVWMLFPKYTSRDFLSLHVKINLDQNPLCSKPSDSNLLKAHQWAVPMSCSCSIYAVGCRWQTMTLREVARKSMWCNERFVRKFKVAICLPLTRNMYAPISSQ